MGRRYGRYWYYLVFRIGFDQFQQKWNDQEQFQTQFLQSKQVQVPQVIQEYLNKLQSKWKLNLFYQINFEISSEKQKEFLQILSTKLEPINPKEVQQNIMDLLNYQLDQKYQEYLLENIQNLLQKLNINEKIQKEILKVFDKKEIDQEIQHKIIKELLFQIVLNDKINSSFNEILEIRQRLKLPNQVTQKANFFQTAQKNQKEIQKPIKNKQQKILLRSPLQPQSSLPNLLINKNTNKKCKENQVEHHIDMIIRFNKIEIFFKGYPQIPILSIVSQQLSFGLFLTLWFKNLQNCLNKINNHWQHINCNRNKKEQTSLKETPVKIQIYFHSINPKSSLIIFLKLRLIWSWSIRNIWQVSQSFLVLLLRCKQRDQVSQSNFGMANWTWKNVYPFSLLPLVNTLPTIKMSTPCHNSILGLIHANLTFPLFFGHYNKNQLIMQNLKNLVSWNEDHKRLKRISEDTLREVEKQLQNYKDNLYGRRYKIPFRAAKIILCLGFATQIYGFQQIKRNQIWVRLWRDKEELEQRKIAPFLQVVEDIALLRYNQREDMIDKATMSPEDYQRTRKRFHEDLEQTYGLQPNQEIFSGVQKHYNSALDHLISIQSGSNPSI